MELKESRVKKSWKRTHYSSNLCPYPVTLRGLAECSGKHKIQGKYNGSNVVVSDFNQMMALYNLGYFGKGSLSRGVPVHKKNRELAERLNKMCTEMEVQTCETPIKSQSTSHELCTSLEHEGSHTMHHSPVCNEQLGSTDLPEKEPTLEETLHLNLEEAFFLSYGLGCLQIIDLFGKELSIQETWDMFCEFQDDFIQKYVVYHYYRAKGWVVKPGLKFGGDFLLYQHGPAMTHATYIILIEVVTDKGILSEEHDLPISWVKYMGLNRVAETAGKEILLCRVVWPQGVLLKDGHSPNIIKQFTVQEILLRRWISSQEREQLDQEEL